MWRRLTVTAEGPVALARRLWLTATIVLTLAPFLVAIRLAPAADAAPSPALVWLLFVGSSAHVGATAWFYTVREVRSHMSKHPQRYVRIPVALVVGSSILAVVVSTQAMTWLLLVFFAWQFFHFQKQNLGVAALACKSVGAGRLSRLERNALTASGVGGIAALIGHPALLQLEPGRELTWLFPAGVTVFSLAVLAGVFALITRPAVERAFPFVTVYVISLLFFLPVFVFSSPYAAVAGLTVAHGLQYLLLVGLLAGAPGGLAPFRVRILIFVNIALFLGLLLNQASHLHDGNAPARLVFGAYLGLVMAHFVVDAGLWRLRDEFPRTFLAQRLPYLLAP